ncbi:MAG: DUF3307 domain-containing protein [Clostridiaceae bacterium]|nr:DUF3307 domain-containing protein [Clostridiaceae bacterium]
MFKEIFVLMLLGHILGDYYTQTDSVAQKKNKHIKWVFFHALCYWVVALVVAIPVMSTQVAVFVSIAAAAHLAIDYLNYIYVSARKKRICSTDRFERNLFFADQILHLLSIVFIAYLFVMRGNVLVVHPVAARAFETLGVSAVSVMNWSVALLAIHKPANFVVSRVLMMYKTDQDDNPDTSDKKAGRLIGTLERTITLILISLNQYAAIALVLTAKSIARYDKISKDPVFSEYYLIGTLLSNLLVIAISFIL